jgi:hypothetical protein
LNTEDCDPPHDVTHPEHASKLFRDFEKNGWAPDKPALIGYPWEGKIQLVSGSHRWAAANANKMKIPVVIRSFDEVKRIWGTDEWLTWLREPPMAGVNL